MARAQCKTGRPRAEAALAVDRRLHLAEKIREIIRSHPTTRKDYFHVVVHDSGAHSLDVLVYFFLAVPD